MFHGKADSLGTRILIVFRVVIARSSRLIYASPRALELVGVLHATERWQLEWQLHGHGARGHAADGPCRCFLSPPQPRTTRGARRCRRGGRSERSEMTALNCWKHPGKSQTILAQPLLVTIQKETLTCKPNHTETPVTCTLFLDHTAPPIAAVRARGSYPPTPHPTHGDLGPCGFGRLGSKHTGEIDVGMSNNHTRKPTYSICDTMNLT